MVPKVDKLSCEDLNRLDLLSDLGFFFLNFGMVMPPVIRFEVDLESSFISDIVERSITDLESFFSADGVKLLSNTSRAASVSKLSVSTCGQIYRPNCLEAAPNLTLLFLLTTFFESRNILVYDRTFENSKLW